MITDFRLQVFDTVARELSFTRAAEELNISQPAVTKHIKELERLLSTPLFRRSGNRIALTEQGEMLRRYVREILEGYNRLNDAIAEGTGEYSGRLKIGASSTIMQYILPEILARFRRSYPSIEVSLMGGNSKDVLQEVEQERVDIALVEDAHTSPTFHYEGFAEDRIILLSAHGSRHTIGIEELKNLPLVLRESGSGTLDVVIKELHKYNISRKMLKIEMQIGSSEGIVRYLKSSKCYAFISESTVREYLNRKELHITDIKDVNIIRSLRFAMLHGHNSRLAELFKNFCKENLP